MVHGPWPMRWLGQERMQAPDGGHGHFHGNELMTWKAAEAKDFHARTLGQIHEAFLVARGS